MLNKNLNKKGVSIIIGYVLLVVFAMVTGTVVYKTVKTYVPKDVLSCPEQTSIFIENINYTSNELILTLTNNGLFDIAGYSIYGTTEPSQELATKDLSEFIKKQGVIVANKVVLFTGETNSMKSDDTKINSFQLDEKIYSIEVTPVRFQEEGGKERFVSCGNSKTNADLKMECGVCGTASTCSEGYCVCDSGYENCDSNFINGCECDTSGTNVCFGGSCCTPKVCDLLSCGIQDNGCGGTVDCGVCDFGVCGTGNEAGTCVMEGIVFLGTSATERAYDLKQTSDGGYIVAGETYEIFSYTGLGDRVALVTKLNKNGEINWSKTIGGNMDDLSKTIQQTADGGYILAGYTYSFGVQSRDALFAKLNSNGDLEWLSTFGGFYQEGINSIIQTTDGEYIATGTANYNSGADILILRLKSNGEINWSKAINRGSISNNNAYTITRTIDGGYIVGGYSGQIFGDEDGLIIKLYSNGTIDWSKVIGGEKYDAIFSIQQTNDEGYIVAGRTRSFNVENYDILIAKLYPNGDIDWAKTIGGSSYDYSRSVIQTTDGGYAIIGYTRSFGAGDYDLLVTKLKPNGDLDWIKTIGWSNYDYGYSILQTADGGYIVAGESDYFDATAGEDDLLIVKLDSEGNINNCGWSQTTPSVNFQSVSANSVNQELISQTLLTETVLQSTASLDRPLTENQVC